MTQTENNHHENWLVGDEIIVHYYTCSYGIVCQDKGLVEYIGIIDNIPMLKTLSGIPRNIALYLPHQTYENVSLMRRTLKLYNDDLPIIPVHDERELV